MEIKGINRNQLKCIAIVCMLIDHIAWAFVPTASVFGQIMHFVGRFTGPVMAYFLYEGYIHTSDKKRYGMRLFIFALISWIPYCSFEFGRWCIYPSFGVIYSLFLGFLAMVYYERHENSGRFRDDLVLLFLCVLSVFGDWPIFDVLWPYFLFRFRDDRKKQLWAFWMVSLVSVFASFDFSRFTEYLFQLGIIVPCLVITYCYNGMPGKKSGFSKWFFYIFYPLHLAVLTAIIVYLK